jgi:hypothetical protein
MVHCIRMAWGFLLERLRREASVLGAWLFVVFIALSVLGCASSREPSSLAARFPGARVHAVCMKPEAVGRENEWGYTPGGQLVSAADADFALVAAKTGLVFTYQAEAPSESVRILPIPYSYVDCGTWLAEQIQNACPAEVAAPLEQRPDPSLVAQTVPDVHSPLVRVPVATYAPNCEQLLIAARKREAWDTAKAIGFQIAYVIEEAKVASDQILHSERDTFSIIERLETLDKYQAHVAGLLDAIPALPLYDDPELAAIAQKGFEKGFGAGVAMVQLKWEAVEAAVLLVTMLPSFGATAGVSAFRGALARIRSMPIFVPATAEGGGFFLRLPKGARPPVFRPPATPPNATTNAVTGSVTTTITRTKPTGQLHDHHLMTNKNYVSTAQGGPWSPKFEEMAKRAGMTLEDAANRVRIPGHRGPHPQAYHEEVYNRLSKATVGLSGEAYAAAFRVELAKIRTEAATVGTRLNQLLVP